ncbi:MAG TPA: NHL repeat-containing protein [Chloroflexia bacterium]|nr:NHL repeat-containing protein [Chloroflexia bacterium]
MSRPMIFDCPSCGAPLRARDDDNDVLCEYCGNTIIVPGNMRPDAPQTFQIVINHGQPTITHHPAYTMPPAPVINARPASRGCGCALAWVLLMVFIIGVGAVVSGAAIWGAGDFNFIEDLTSSGYARQVMTFGGEGTGPGQLDDVVDVAVDGSGNVYAAEYGTGRIQRFSSAGAYLNGWTIEGERHPSALAADQSGNVYVVTSNQIMKYEGPTGKPLGTFSSAKSDFLGFYDVAVFPNGDLLTYTRGSTGDLVRLDPNGQEVGRYSKAIVGSGNTSPVPWQVRVAADSLGNMLALYTDSSRPEVFTYAPDGKLTRRFGGKGDADGQFSSPDALAVDGKGRIYVGDWKGVQVFDRSGIYLGLIKLQRGTASGMAFNDKNELFVVSRSVDHVSKFVLSQP